MKKEGAVPLSLDLDQEAGKVAVLSPLVRRLIAPNASPMTFKGTCTYIVGHDAVAIIDPGPEMPEHIDLLLAVLGSERVAQIVVTHTHRDHSPGARLLKAKTGAPIVGCAPYRPARTPHGNEIAAIAASNDLDHTPDHVLEDGEALAGHGFALTAVATPGHTMNHLAFALAGDNVLFSGDHVMAWSTTIVSPPTGSMTAYMASLQKLRARKERIYWPGHGGPVMDPQRFLRALQHHRRQRELAIVGRLKQGDETADSIVAAIYDSLEPRLKRAAAQSVLAHLEDLLARGRVIQTGEPGLAGRFKLVA